MKVVRSLLLSLPLAGVALLSAPDTHACGGCVVPPDESTQVTGHRMIFATSKTQTTLYDQIEYSGDPESFAWFLPIKGEVQVGLSSDALFAFLGQASSVQVLPPPLNCPDMPPGCEDWAFGGSEDGGASGAGGNSPANGVDVWKSEVVGPYETVQLKAEEPGALLDWFATHGYDVPDDVKPIISAYQQEGFGFLAMQLVPGEGVNAMQPVRVTAPGAGMGLPLRMVAAGTGAVTPITLFVVGEGRYEPQNFTNIPFDPTPIVFHWDDYTSNYNELVKAVLAGYEGKGWLTQSADVYPKQDLFWQVEQVIDFNPGQTGWGTETLSEWEHAQEDLDTLFAGMTGEVWLTRLHAQLSRPALATDLILQAEASQEKVSRFIQAKFADGKTPPCPDYSWCANDGDNGGNFNGIGQGEKDLVGGKGKCAVDNVGGDSRSAALFFGVGLAAAAAVVRRRRARK